ncbi:MAG: hypothetical protein KDD60_04010, partial [Bdellovibrionales bacterium]|nr:hypothetical protein [Bdellovibrionales bacterium]
MFRKLSPVKYILIALMLFICFHGVAIGQGRKAKPGSSDAQAACAAAGCTGTCKAIYDPFTGKITGVDCSTEKPNPKETETPSKEFQNAINQVVGDEACQGFAENTPPIICDGKCCPKDTSLSLPQGCIYKRGVPECAYVLCDYDPLQPNYEGFQCGNVCCNRESEECQIRNGVGRCLPKPCSGRGESFCAYKIESSVKRVKTASGKEPICCQSDTEKCWVPDAPSNSSEQARDAYCCPSDTKGCKGNCCKVGEETCSTVYGSSEGRCCNSSSQVECNGVCCNKESEVCSLQDSKELADAWSAVTGRCCQKDSEIACNGDCCDSR